MNVRLQIVTVKGIVLESSLGQRLAEVRGREGLSQKAFAERLGVSKAAVARIESGTLLPSREFLLKLSSKFQVSTDWLLHGSIPVRAGPDPILLMICGSAVDRVYASLSRPLPRDEHYRWALWVLDQLQGRMKDPSNGDELEELMPEIRDLLAKRILSEG